MSAAVNQPTNTKVKEQDINQKLQLYGIYSAFALGKVPSNKQIDVAMNSALASRPLAKPSTKLSTEGKELVADLRDVIEKAKVLLLTKNEGNLIQDFIYQCTKITPGDATVPSAALDKETAKQHGNEALEGLRTLGQLLISNGQFRKLLNDAVVLLRDIAADSAQKGADVFRPDQDRLAQIDRPAEDNTWHDVPKIDDLKAQARDKMPFGKEDAKDAIAKDAQTNADGTVAAANLKSQVPEDQKEKASETKEKTKEQLEKTRQYLDEKVPKERRDQTIWRLKKMIVEIQGHQDYQRAIDTLLRLAETYQGHAGDLSTQSKDSVKGAHSDDGLKNAEANLKVLIERFANSTSTDDWFDSINQIYRDANQDPELRGWFEHIDRFVRRCLKEQGYVMQDDVNNEWDKLYNQGNFLLRERYRNHTDRVVDETKFLADQFEQDPQNKAFADSMNKLFNDLGNDKNGKPVFKKHLVKDISEVILPAFFENVRYVPIPRIEYSDPMADAIVENLVIEGDNLAPNAVEFGSDNYFRWGRKSIKNQNKNKIMLSVSGIQMDLRDVSYYIKKKQGFPSITDKGVMDIFLGGSGLSFKAALETADEKDKNHFFKVNNITVDIKNLNIKLKKSNHKLIFAIIRPLLLRVMRPILQKVIAQQVKNNINQLDAVAHEIYLDAKREAKANENNPDDTTNMFQRYFNAAQRRATADKQKKEAAKDPEKKGQANVAMTQHESLFKDIKLEGGVSSKATEYRDLAKTGEKWESPVFAIGAAKESTNLPKAPQVARKPHRVTASQLKDKSQSQFASANGNATTAGNSALNGSRNTSLGVGNPVLSGSA